MPLSFVYNKVQRTAMFVANITPPLLKAASQRNITTPCLNIPKGFNLNNPVRSAGKTAQIVSHSPERVE